MGMNTTKQIKKHETLIEVLEAIKTFKQRIHNAKWDIEWGFIGQFPRLRSEYIHRIEIYQMCIARLEMRYTNLIKQL